MPPRVAILGGGFGGLYLARAIIGRAPPGAAPRIVLVDRGERFVFKPLLYELITGEVDEEEIAPRFADILDPRTVELVRAEVRAIDLDARRVHLAGAGGPAALDFDALAIALGTEPWFYELPGLAQHALPAATLDDFRRLRARLDEAAAAAAANPRPGAGGDARRLRVGICGAGPSGIEIACKLADLGWGLDVVVVEASQEILRGFGEEIKAEARAALREKGIELRLGTPVVAADERGLVLPDDSLPADIVVWTAGQRPVAPVRALPAPRDPLGRLLVGATLELPGHSGVFALGDVAKCVIEGAEPPPATAQVAVQQASVVAKNILARLSGRTLTSYRYFPLAETLSLGRGSDVLQVLGLKLSGRAGRIARRLVYLARLPTLRHRAKVAARWGARAALEAAASLFARK